MKLPKHIKDKPIFIYLFIALIIISTLLVPVYFSNTDEVHSNNNIESPDKVDVIPEVPVVETIKQYPIIKKIAAVVRIQQAADERKHILDPYRRYFGHVAISRPELDGAEYTLTTDPHPEIWCGNDNSFQYQYIGRYIRGLPTSNPEIEGVLYYHADLWVDPQQFEHMNFTNLWMLGRHSGLLQDLPQCQLFDGNPDSNYKETSRLFTVWDGGNVHKKLVAEGMTTLPDIEFEKTQYTYCTAWTDMWYIPKSMFKTFPDLTDLFFKHQMHVDEAIPTAINIMLSQKSNVGINLVEDCAGSCCESINDPEIFQAHRCGHKFP